MKKETIDQKAARECFGVSSDVIIKEPEGWALYGKEA